MTGAEAAAAFQPPPSPWATPDVVPISAAGAQLLPRSVRQVLLTRSGSGLGFNIVGGENGEGIFVSFVLAGGAADASGDIHRGDQLLEVNGESLEAATHEQAAAALRRAGARVQLLVAYRPEEYNRFEARIQDLREQMLSAGGGSLRTTQKRSLYVRALFDYDPSRDAGLPNKGIAFRRGDILHVTNASDDEWWQARRVAASAAGGGEQQQAGGFGIIPSKRRVERRERAKLRKVNFNRAAASPVPAEEASAARNATLEKKKKSSLLRKLQIRGRDQQQLQQQQQQQQEDAASDQEEADASLADQRIPTYEVVQQAELQLARPVVVLGPVKEAVNSALVLRRPQQFAACVPHTTRQPRPGEVDGREYHFVASRQQMEADIAGHLFAEAGQFNGNLYGTALSTVRTTAEAQRHCVLDVSGNAIRRLQAAGLHPISIFVRPHSPEHVMQLRPDVGAEQARKLYDKACRLEAEFGADFTATVSGSSVEEILHHVLRVISQNAGSIVWVASADQQI